MDPTRRAYKLIAGTDFNQLFQNNIDCGPKEYKLSSFFNNDGLVTSEKISANAGIMAHPKVSSTASWYLKLCIKTRLKSL